MLHSMLAYFGDRRVVHVSSPGKATANARYGPAASRGYGTTTTVANCLKCMSKENAD